MRNDITSAEYMEREDARYEQARKLALGFLEKHTTSCYDTFDDLVENFHWMLLATEDCY